MASLPNPKHELFSRYISQGKTLVDAYELSGYARNAGGASQLYKNNPDIKARVEELMNTRTAMMDRLDPGKLQPHTAGAVRNGELVIDKAWVMAELVENLELAREAGQLSAANKAIELVGAELGMFGKGKVVDEDNKTPEATKVVSIPELTRILDAMGPRKPDGQLVTTEDLIPKITGEIPRGRPKGLTPKKK